MPSSSLGTTFFEERAAFWHAWPCAKGKLEPSGALPQMRCMQRVSSWHVQSTGTPQCFVFLPLPWRVGGSFFLYLVLWISKQSASRAEGEPCGKGGCWLACSSGSGGQVAVASRTQLAYIPHSCQFFGSLPIPIPSNRYHLLPFSLLFLHSHHLRTPTPRTG